ncbi:MAG: shikimate dehydrogenase [Acholeplasmataceae bacterium]|nr:shikimate dehydrogenase [Acholeplasmataceae bacterium]
MSDRYGLIGKNISHSKSPQIHSFMAKKLGLDIKYDLFDIEESDISHLLKHLRSGVFKGFNVTVPYKQVMMKHVDILTPKASRIRAVNTIYMKNGKIIGDNTDYDGFLGLLNRNRVNVKDKQVYLLGAGGAAKAAYIVLSDLGAKVTVVSRQTNDLDPLFQHIISYQKIDPFKVEIYVQATPIGTYPKVDDSVLSKVYVENQTVIDLVYNPPVTKIMKDAKLGIGGIYMLIIQAIKSEEIWFDRKIDITDKLVEELKEIIYHE